MARLTYKVLSQAGEMIARTYLLADAIAIALCHGNGSKIRNEDLGQNGRVIYTLIGLDGSEEAYDACRNKEAEISLKLQEEMKQWLSQTAEV